MKKIISIMFSVLLALSVSITTFASTDDEALLGVETQIKEAVFEKFYESRYPDMPLDDIHIYIYCTSSDGGIYFSEWAEGFGAVDVYVEKTIGDDYYYCYNAGEQVYLYKDGMINELKEAYDNGIINDNTLAEIDPMINNLLPKIGESGLDSKIEWDLKYYLYNIYFGSESTISHEKIESIQIHYYGTTSDGNMYVSYTVPDIVMSDEMLNYTMGEYVYNVTADKQVYFFHDEKYRTDTFCTIQEAYDNGLIDDDMLSEVSALNFGLVNINDVTEPTETTTPDSADLELQIKQDANEYFYDGNANVDDINVVRYGTLSDGSPVVNIYRYGGAATVTFSYIIGNYEYHCHAGDEAYIYKDNNFYFIVDAYESGLINDDTLDELYNCSVEYLKNPLESSYFLMYPLEIETTTQSVENTTQPTETTTPDATSSTDAPEADPTTAIVETKPASTSDTATANNSNNAVQTGQSSFAIMTTLLVIALSGAVVVFTKYGYNK